jgi:hypothetical protein
MYANTVVALVPAGLAAIIAVTVPRRALGELAPGRYVTPQPFRPVRYVTRS